MRAILSAVCVLLFAQCAWSETVERSANASPTGEVEIVNVAGDVRVIGWERAQVQVEADLGRGVERLEFETKGDRTFVEVKLPKHGGSSSGSSLVVQVPQGSSLRVKTVSAEQAIENVRGEQRLQSVSGEIETQVWSDEFEAKSVSGNIDVRGQGQRGSMRISSVSGDIAIDNHGGEFEVTTVNGAIEIDATEVSRARLKTTNGEAQLTAALAAEARVDAETINGELSVFLRGEPNAEFDIETFNGDIDNCFGPEPQRTSQYAPGRALRFKEGEGGARVRLKTLNGEIELCKK